MRRALVTGGASPLGEAICRQLAADGLHVIVHGNANSRPGVAALAAELRRQRRSPADITDVAETEAALAAGARRRPGAGPGSQRRLA